MFNMESRPTITESVVESAVSAIKLAYSMSDFTADSPRISVGVLAFTVTSSLESLSRGLKETKV